MLIAIAALVLIFGFGGSNNVAHQFNVADDRIKKVVTDRQRRDQALAIVKEMKKTAETSAKDQKKSIESVQQLLDRRTASTGEIDAALRTLDASDDATANRLVELRFQLSGVLNRQEWGAVFVPPSTSSEGKVN
jgi:hypothetical protein